MGFPMEVMKTFPAVPVIAFGTSRKEMANERKTMALQILDAYWSNTNLNAALSGHVNVWNI